MLKKTIIILGLVALSACKAISDGASDPDPNANVTAPYIGHWLSDCTDLGGGSVNRIYLEINSNQTIDIAILSYQSTNCTGAYVLKNSSGITITAPEYAQNFAEQTVTDIPSSFYVLNIVTIANSASQYVVMYVNDHDLYELTGFTNPHDTWNSWLGEADVSQFAANPTTYNPNTAIKYHFTKSELP